VAVGRRGRRALAALLCVAAAFGAAARLRGGVEGEVSDADLTAISARTIALRAASGGPIAQVPLELYVARVLAGEGEPNAPDATQQALAVAVRTYAVFNMGRHRRDGFDLCDAVHCQVPRAATASSRRATLATAGRILTYRGAPAEIFYSASCGGRSEVASAVWPTVNHPYLRSVTDDVHDEDMPWTLNMDLSDVQTVMNRNGFAGELQNVSVASRNKSGRAAVLKLSGMHPDRIAADQFRAVVGTTVLRSTAFSINKHHHVLEFTGRGYGHGVGMCVIGAGRRARRGETMAGILGHYYPGLRLETLPR
jgi:stage II sporulation protein D